MGRGVGGTVSGFVLLRIQIDNKNNFFGGGRGGGRVGVRGLRAGAGVSELVIL